MTREQVMIGLGITAFIVSIPAKILESDPLRIATLIILAGFIGMVAWILNRP